MGGLRDVYGNSKKSGYALDFFRHSASGARQAFLASPFFTTIKPIKVLTATGCEVRLLVRLCCITTPTALAEAIADPLVTIRYFTSPEFHAKLYIVDDHAMIGSANLTEAGLMSNREVSVILNRERDACFEELPGLFNLFWDAADVFNDEVLEAYKRAYRVIGKPTEEKTFEAELGKHLTLVNPPSAMAGSEIVSKKRSFIQGLRRKYDELIIPAYDETAALFIADGRRRREFASGDPEIEINRFLGWARLVHAPGDGWKQSPLGDREARRHRTSAMIDAWHAAASTGAGNMIEEDREVEKIERLRHNLGSATVIAALDYDELFETLICCHAFLELLRFSSGGLPGLREDFRERNSLAQIKETLTYLLHGPGSALERAYDCIYSEKFKLGRFGESCVMELTGWLDPERPPINGRTVKALRFLGHAVPE